MRLKYILFALLTLTLSQSRAQAPTWAWAQTIISNQAAQNQAFPAINGMTTDSSGNIYITGFFYDSLRMGNTLLAGYGKTNMFLAKYSANGIVQWATQNNGDKNTAASGNGICLDNTGNIYICGGITDTVQFDNFYINSKGNKMFMASYNPITGKCENVRQIGHALNYSFSFDTANTGTLYKIFIDASGNLYLSGYAVSNNVVDFGGQGISGVFVVKYDQYFNMDWINAVTNAGAALSLLIDSAGDAFSVGNFYGSVTCDYNTIKSTDVNADNSYLVSYNNSNYGNLNWFKSIGGYPYTYSATSNNGSFIYLTGDFEDSCIFDSSLFFIDKSFYGIYTFVAKYDWAGNIVWAKMLSSYLTSTDDKIGNTISCGIFQDSVQIGNDKISAPGNNLFAVKLDGNGNLLWAEHDSISASRPQNLFQPYLSTIDNAGNVIVAMLYPDIYTGNNKKDSLNFVLGGDTVKMKANYGNIILAKLGNAPTGISLLTLPETAVKLFPNPTDGQFTIYITKPFSLSNIEVYNIVGQQCNATVNYSQDKLKATVTMKNAATGVYTVILSSGASKVAKLFVKQ